MPLRCLCELKKFASVTSHVSSHLAILLRNFCIILLFTFMAWFEISNEIERRFYQEALSPDLKWRKQGLASLGRCCLIENAMYPPNCEVFKPASKSGYPNICCVDIFKKIWESSSSFLSWLRFMKVGKVEKNFPWATSKNRLKHLIPILMLTILGPMVSQNKKRTSCNIVRLIDISKRTITSNEDNASTLNNYFCSVGSMISSNVEITTK